MHFLALHCCTCCHSLSVCSDSVASHGRDQAKAVIEYLGKRPSVKDHQSSLVGTVTAVSGFDETRKNLVQRLSGAVDEVLAIPGSGAGAQRREELDKERLFASLRQTAIVSSSMQAGAAGTGLLLALNAIDPSAGWAGVSVLCLGGLASSALGRARAKRTYSEQWSRKAGHLRRAFAAISKGETETVHKRILDGVAPYTRFVETERDRIGDLRERCEAVSAASRNLRNRIQKLR